MNTRARPTVYHGLPVQDDDTRIVDAALADIGDRLNEVPDHLGLRVICSVLLTSCCAQDNPMDALRVILANVLPEIEVAMAEEAGKA